MDFRDGLFVAVLFAVICSLGGWLAGRHGIMLDCNTISATVINGEAYTCFKELTEKDD